MKMYGFRIFFALLKTTLQQAVAEKTIGTQLNTYVRTSVHTKQLWGVYHTLHT